MDLKKYLKRTSAAMVAGTFLFTSSAAFANEEVSLDQVNETETTAETTVDPGLTPDNFFYFLDGFFENVTLLLTFDDKEKAETYAKYAAEKMAEAEILFEQGNQEDALEVLNDALKYMSQSEEDAAEEEATENEEATEDEEVTEDEEATEDEEVTEDEEATEDEEVTEDEEAIEDEEATEDEEVSEEDEAQDEFEGIKRQNIVALKHALTKVKNPNARAALQRNIDKTYAKIKAKLDQIEDEEATEEEATEEEVTEGTTEETTDEEEVSSELETDTDLEVEASTEEELDQLPVINKQERKEAKEEAKQERKEAKDQAKQEKKESKKGHDKSGNPGKGHGKSNNPGKGNKN